MTEELTQWLQSLGTLSLGSAIILAVIFFLASFVFVPRTFLYLAVGGLYGFPIIPIILSSNVLGSICAFLLARHSLANPLRRKVDQYTQLRAIADAIDSESWRIVALLRFASPIPSAVQNYFFGFTRIGLWPYAIATFVFTLPQTFLYIYLGSIGRSILLEESSSPLSRILMLIGIASLLAVGSVVWRKARKALLDSKLDNALRV
jgi:uncharacterized membrane protein YdjX (TVP38/TMEM64 family)